MIILTPEKPKHACPDTKDKVGDAREVIITIDGKLGEMKVNPKGTRVEGTDEMFSYKKEVRSSSVAFLNPNLKKEDQYKFAKTGKIKITKKAPDMIEGLVLAKFDPDNFINGKFRAKICKWGQLN